jgi:hypothetical protein
MIKRAKKQLSFSFAIPAAGPPPSMHEAQGLASRAFVDPNDPTTIFISQPVGESQRLAEAPRCVVVGSEE